MRKLIKTRAALSALGNVVADKVSDIKTDYAEKKDVLVAAAEVEKTQAEINAAEAKKAALAQQVKDARKAARDAARELKQLAETAMSTPAGDDVPAPNTADNVVSI